MAGPRQRYREQVRDEIRTHAWSQVATTGASALSLNAIAKQMGMSGPALYRYYAGRDELITELVLEAYRDLADACEAAAASARTPAAKLSALAQATREWAVAEPHRYLLIYGTPVPGYHAPPEATAITARMMAVLVDAFAQLAPPATSAAAAAFEKDLATHRAWSPDDGVSEAVLRRALVFWTRMQGVLSLEIAGHFTGMTFDPALLYAAEVEAAIS
ncbi:TetR/AcrR family transcriptional regulator [Fodinicola acaciae]|uniref:TetR/AcrR family transcriptional regulator n=1 Tax=Fodinicola acaciae TaxID=2681555 RepID=UPI0013D7F7AC|nr:TetR/AcrR family transcriptional regulator [Fodinicola acaciae]